MRKVGMARAPRLLTALLALAALLALTLALGACGGSDSKDDGGSGDQKGEIEITCGTCEPNPTDPSQQFMAESADLFNRKYAGRYHVKTIKNPQASASFDRLQYLQRLALANDLPDLFLAGPSEMRVLDRTGKLMDFKPALDADPDWQATYQDGVFDAISDDDHTWAIPITRDAIGTYWNRALFREAGIAEFPQTWDDFEAACERLAAIDKKCYAADGEWTTLLMWANLLGTQEDGKAFLDGGIREGDYSTVPAAVRASETLKSWHTKGWTNPDAFAADYQRAATAFIRGEAAMIGNGPWMVNSDIKTKNAIKGLYDNVGYEVAPGWTADKRGVVVISAEGSYGSGTQEADKQEAVIAFIKFLQTHERVLRQITFQGAYPATKFTATPDEKSTLEPLGAGVVEKSRSVAMTYPTAYFNSPGPFPKVWDNLWPAYVKGKLSTQEFLSKLAEDAQSVTGG